MVAFGAADPRNATLKDSEVIRSICRLLVNDGTNNTVETTDATNICIGVSAGESSRDADHDFERPALDIFPLGGS